MADFDLGARKYREAVKVLTSLEGAGYPARLAGGCVRDRLRGVEPVDFDVATVAKPDEVMRHFRAVGWRTVPTGIDHGTVTLVMPSGPVEITTLRVDVATDGRRATVAFGTSFEEDAARRDFTINAMFEDAGGVIYDYYGGQADLQLGMLRFVGDPAQRIREDYLRILRLFRFQSKLDFHDAPGTLAAVRAESQGLTRISQERITSELLQIFAGDAAAKAVKGMRDAGVWSLVLPEFAGADGDDPKIWRHVGSMPRDRRPLGALAVFGRGAVDAESFTRLGERLRLKTTDTRALAFVAVAQARLARVFVDTADQLDFVDAVTTHVGADALTTFLGPVLSALGDSRAVAQLAEVQRTEELHGHLRTAKLPLDGARLMDELGITAGPALGEALADLRRGFRNSAWRTADEGLRWLRRKAP